jgi:hypothetical protein
MRFGFVGPSYTAQSSAIADEECINLFAETNEAGSYGVQSSAYGGGGAHALKSYLWTPGLSVFATLPTGPVRGSFNANGWLFVVADTKLYEIDSNGAQTERGYIFTDGNPVSIAFNGIQLLIVGGGHAYCFTLATNELVEVTSKLAGVPKQCDCSDTIGIVIFQDSNKFQMSDVLDFTTWPGLLVNEVSVFPDNITSMIVNHRELWIFGEKRSQPYQNTGSANVFDVIEGALLEMGSAATFGVQRVDNSVFWIGQDERGALMAWRSNGYTPQRVSTHAVEVWLSQQARVSELASYAYQERGHLFWVLYVPGSDCNWVYDVGEGLWHKCAAWIEASAKWQSHWSWNHVYAFGKHLVGDWNSGNLYELNFENLNDDGTAIRRLRRSPTVTNEKKWIYHSQLTVDFETGLGPQPPLVDGDGNDRAPQAMLRWSDDRGKTWSNQHVRDCGLAGEYSTRVFWNRLGRSRNRVYELSMTDPIPWVITDAYLEVS